MVVLERIAVMACLLAAVDVASAFSIHSKMNMPLQRSVVLSMSTTPNFNAVEVAKTGGAGAITASQQALAQNLSLGAPPVRPKGGHYLTKGGVQVTANVNALEFSKSKKPGTSEAAIENLVEKLDSQKGVLLTSSYEFPGRYARWSLGFVDPALEISGKADKCTIKALNARGKVLLPAVENAMKQLKEDGLLASMQVYQDKPSGAGTETQLVQIDVQVVPPPKVGTFSEEERSRQVRKTSTHTQVSIIIRGNVVVMGAIYLTNCFVFLFFI
jgi:anthranilate synthase